MQYPITAKILWKVMGRYAYSAISAEDFARGASDRKKVFVLSVLAIQKLKTSMSAERQREEKSMSHTHGEWLDRIRGRKRKEKSMRLIDADAIPYNYTNERGVPMTREIDIQNMPTIEERKTGEWITTRTWEHDGEIYCDQCGSEAPTEGDYRQIKTNFCPDCGAKMKGEKP